MNPKRKMLRAERERKARIRRIRKECCKVERLGRGRHRLQLVVGHQGFTISGGDFTFESDRRARWFATQLAIALNRFKHGD